MLDLNLNELLELTTDQRQLRLFAVACCKSIWHLLTDQRSRNAVEVAEQFADGLVTEKELAVARRAAWDAAWAARDAVWIAAWAAAKATESDAVKSVANAAAGSVWYAAARAAENGAWYTERKQQLVFLQDITNQPSVELNPIILSWNNSLLSKFATNIYTNKDFNLMPILADALEEANAPTIFIEHAREKVHVKGCWLLDVLMGKR